MMTINTFAPRLDFHPRLRCKSLLRASYLKAGTLGGLVLGVGLGLALMLVSPPLKAKEMAPPTCGYSSLFPLKYNGQSRHFDYVNPAAPKGGKVRVARVGTFNSLNFLRYPGTTLTDRKQPPLDIAAYLFDSLLVRSADEPAAYYCLLAEKIEVSKDRKTVKFHLNQQARFHDGKVVGVKDVVFTFETLKTQGAPFYRQVLAKYSARAMGDNIVEFQNNGRPDRDFVSIVGTLPVHPAHFKPVTETAQKSMALPLGSGPYRVKAAAAGEFAHLERVKTYWAREHFTQKGRYNFDEILIDYYRDARPAMEAYKVGKYDIRLEENPLSWANDYKGLALKGSEIHNISLPASQTGDLYMLVFNQRHSIFKNAKVRRAFSLLYDFESANRILYHGLYKKAGPIYGVSELSANGAASLAERQLMAPFLKRLPEGILQTSSPDDDQENNAVSTSSREKFRLASQLLDEAGYIVKGEKRIDPATGKPLVLSVSYLQAEHQRIIMHFARSLKTLGIELSAPNLEPTAASRKALSHDFDLMILKWSPEYQPGRSEFLLWSSVGTKKKLPYAFGGLEDPALDRAIFAMSGARTAADLKTATRVFDRIFRWQYHAIPLWRADEKWISYKSHIKKPARTPEIIFSLLDHWWADPQSHAGK